RKEDDRPVRVDVVRVLESTLRMAWNEVRHRARLRRDYSSVPPVIGTDSRLGQVFLNLVVNAAQAFEEGHADTNEICVSTRQEGERVVVEIADTGPGLPAQVQRRLFDPFVTTKAAGVGTGLGLSICHRIVTELGGTIGVTSAPRRGTTFRIELLAASDAEQESVSGADALPGRSGRRGSVLVIDDEPAIGRAVRRVLGRDHDVVSVTSGAAGLARIAAGERFDLILCDVMMPEMMGVEVHAALAKSTPDQAAKLVFLTGGIFAPDAQKYLDAGSLARLEKPFDPRPLRAFVEERLRT
ncbi:MAG TPA: ATP-binding protein, partial [Myxococcota bacterium]|nr:ATP-binding protein [Myxococcota bacterium]